jgi:hypothetical protein
MDKKYMLIDPCYIDDEELAIKYMLIDPCYIGDEKLAIRYGSPVAVFNTGDGVFEFDG